MELFDLLMSRRSGGGSYVDNMKNAVIDFGDKVFSFMDEVPEKFKYLDKNVTAVSFPLAKIVGKNSFYSCSVLNSVDFPSLETIGEYAFKSSGVSDVIFNRAKIIGNAAFQGCKSLVNASFPDAEYIDKYAFSGCSALVSIIAPNITSMGDSDVFNMCSMLESVDFPYLTNITSYAFGDCSKLTVLKFPCVESVGVNAFANCYALRTVDFEKPFSLPMRMFSRCGSLTAVIMRSETMCILADTSAFTNCYHFLGTVNSTYNPSGLKDGYVYVPKALIEEYKVATNWSTYADRFRALEDYTIDGTVTGELDESKVGL